jgi:hypothetical protein
LTAGRWPIVKIIAESLSQHDKKHFVPTSLSGIRVGKREGHIGHRMKKQGKILNKNTEYAAI